MKHRLVNPAYWLALPAGLVLTVFVFVPFLAVMRFATWEWSGLSEHEVVGLGNVTRMFRDPEFWRSLFTTFKVMLLTVPLFVLLSRSIALAIYGLWLERFVKALLFLPSLLTIAGSSIAWYLLYNPDFGFIVELTGVALPWNAEPWAGIVYIVLFSLWQTVGYGVLVVSAALKGIPEYVREAARVDGASEGAIRRYITSPLLMPNLLFLAVVSTMFSLQSYTAVYLLTEGAPFGSTRVLGFYLYEVAFRRFQLGYGAMLTIALLVITMSFALLQVALFRSRQ